MSFDDFDFSAFPKPDPVLCDYCDRLTDDPIAEEGDMWSCVECWERNERAERDHQELHNDPAL